MNHTHRLKQHIHRAKDIISNTNIEIDNALINKAVLSLFYTTYVRKGTTVIDIEQGLIKDLCIQGECIREIIKVLINGDEDDVKYIEVIKSPSGVKGDNTRYYILTNEAIKLFQEAEGIEGYDKMYEDIERLNIKESHRYLSGYELAIAQHTSLSHFASISNLSKHLYDADIDYKYIHEDTQIQIPYVRNKVEFDLILTYNRKTYGVEVECGTTSITDMNKKLYKHNLLYKNSAKYKKVIIACPNQKALEHTRNTVETVVKDYHNRYADSFYVEYIYINLSTVNCKNTIRKQLNTSLRRSI